MAKERKLSQGFEDAVRAAFADVNPPSTVTSSNTPDCQEITSALVGRLWTELPGELVDKLATDLPLFTAEYFRYVLPAYLVRSYQTENESLVTHLIYSLQADSIHASSFKSMTPSQRVIIKRFLSWVSTRLKDRDADLALKTW
jgi:hypothetical protein